MSKLLIFSLLMIYVGISFWLHKMTDDQNMDIGERLLDLFLSLIWPITFILAAIIEKTEAESENDQ